MQLMDYMKWMTIRTGDMNFVLDTIEQMVKENSSDAAFKRMNFTDLPMFSPFLANMLGSGTCDAKKCSEQIDSIVLQWFNYYIKGDSVLDIQNIYDVR